MKLFHLGLVSKIEKEYMIVFGEELNVLMIGNNPLELAKVFAHLKKISGMIVNTETVFDLKGGMKSLSKFNPNYILIDDNLGRLKLTKAVSLLTRLKKTKNIPITILKSSNYREAFTGVGMNYILKDSLSGESLYSALKNSLISSRAQQFLKNVHRKRKGQFKKLLTSS